MSLGTLTPTGRSSAVALPVVLNDSSSSGSCRKVCARFSPLYLFSELIRIETELLVESLTSAVIGSRHFCRDTPLSPMLCRCCNGGLGRANEPPGTLPSRSKSTEDNSVFFRSLYDGMNADTTLGQEVLRIHSSCSVYFRVSPTPTNHSVSFSDFSDDIEMISQD
jgi:hypothetical protein